MTRNQSFFLIVLSAYFFIKAIFALTKVHIDPVPKSAYDFGYLTGQSAAVLVMFL